MSMPGFTADVSLPLTNDQYWLASTHASDQSPHQAVIPQISELFIFAGPKGAVCVGFGDYDRRMSY